MNLYKKNNKIYVDYLQGGKRVRKSLRLEWNKVNIEYVKRNILPELYKQSDLGIAYKDYTLKQFCGMILEKTKICRRESTYKISKTRLAILFRYIEDKSIKKYSHYDVEKLIAKMYKDNLASSTIKSVLCIPSMAFKLAIKESIVNTNPFANLSVPTKKVLKREIFTHVQMDKILQVAQGDLKTYLYLAFYTGARPGEILALRGADIANEGIHITKTLVPSLPGKEHPPKAGKTRVIPIPKRLRDYLDKLHLASSKRVIPIGYAQIRVYFRNLLNNLGFTYSGLHSIRHTYASMLLNSGVNNMLIKEVLGHKDLSMLNTIYGHFIEDKDKDLKSIENALK